MKLTTRPSNAEAKNGWSYTYAVSVCLNGCASVAVDFVPVSLNTGLCSVLICSSFISGPGSLPPGLMTKRRIFDDGSSDISSTPSSMLEYTGELCDQDMVWYETVQQYSMCLTCCFLQGR
jgi:hypothetical protein